MRPIEVARFMLTEIGDRPALYKSLIGQRILDNFGPDFARKDSQGRWVIDLDVVREFEGLTAGSVGYDRKLRAWVRNSS